MDATQTFVDDACTWAQDNIGDLQAVLTDRAELEKQITRDVVDYVADNVFYNGQSLGDLGLKD